MIQLKTKAESSTNAFDSLLYWPYRKLIEGGGAMYADYEKDIPRVFRVEERRAEIARILEKEGSITVDRICEQFEVSAVTARGDLNELERRGRLQRVHGGALPVDHTLVVADINDRMNVNVRSRRLSRLSGRQDCWIRRSSSAGQQDR